MTLNTARKIETAFDVATVIATLPFVVAVQILEWTEQLLRLVLKGRGWLSFKAGNRLMRLSDAVRDGTVKNPYALRNYTALMAWNKLMDEADTGKETGL